MELTSVWPYSIQLKTTVVVSANESLHWMCVAVAVVMPKVTFVRSLKLFRETVSDEPAD